MLRFVQVMVLVAWAVDAAAQPAMGPIQTSAMHAAALVALDEKPPVPADDAWSRVQHLARGTDVTVTVDSLGTLRRVVVAADATSLTIARDLDDVTMTTIPRDRVVEVRRIYRAGSPVAASVAFAVAGWFGGSQLVTSLSHCYDLNCLAVGMAGGTIGAITGGMLGHHFFSHDAEETIYRTP